MTSALRPVAAAPCRVHPLEALASEGLGRRAGLGGRVRRPVRAGQERFGLHPTGDGEPPTCDRSSRRSAACPPTRGGQGSAHHGSAKPAPEAATRRARIEPPPRRAAVRAGPCAGFTPAGSPTAQADRQCGARTRASCGTSVGHQAEPGPEAPSEPAAVSPERWQLRRLRLMEIRQLFSSPGKTDVAEPRIGISSVIDGYSVDRELSRATRRYTVYEASGPSGDRVAIKVYRVPSNADGQFRRRFRRQLELRASIQDPHLLRVVGGGSTGTSPTSSWRSHARQRSQPCSSPHRSRSVDA